MGTLPPNGYAAGCLCGSQHSVECAAGATARHAISGWFGWDMELCIPGKEGTERLGRRRVSGTRRGSRSAATAGRGPQPTRPAVANR